MSALTGAAVHVSGRDGAAEAGEVMGAFEILDLQLRVVATGVLLNRRDTTCGPLAPGRYFARASLISGHRSSTPFEIPVAGTGPLTAIIDDAAAGDSDFADSDGWLAGWTFDQGSATFKPIAPSCLIQPTDTTVAVVRQPPGGGNGLIQWTLKQHRPMFTATVPGMPMRFTVGGATAGLDLASGPAGALLTFLRFGDLPRLASSPKPC